MTVLQLTLPWPPRELSPNARLHWRRLAAAKKSYRQACAMVVRQQGAGKIDAPALAVSLTFVPPDRRLRDLDNLIASMKSGMDGLADVFGVDDRAWTLTAAMDRENVGGMVRVEVSPCGA